MKAELGRNNDWPPSPTLRLKYLRDCSLYAYHTRYYHQTQEDNRVAELLPSEVTDLTIGLEQVNYITYPKARKHMR